jgi:hypothetical protein
MLRWYSLSIWKLEEVKFGSKKIGAKDTVPIITYAGLTGMDRRYGAV